MYDELVKELRDSAEWADRLALLMGRAEGDTHAPIMRKAADAIEELSKDLERSKEWEAFWEKEANEALKQFQTAVANKPRWIPVEERLPETGVDVLVMFPHNMAVASRDMGEWVVNSGDGWCTDVNLSDDEKEPTHWMPLPEPPKEETK